jgi:hypothetical protein
MKHPKKQIHQKLNGSSEFNKVLQNGTVTSMVGKDTFSLTFNVDVATSLGFGHNETLRYEVSGDRLIVRKGSA